MSKKTLQRKSKALAEIKSASEMGGLIATFLNAFGYKLEAKVQIAKQLKANLVTAGTQIDRYQAWRRIDDMYQDMLVRAPADLEAMKAKGIDLESLTKAYIRPDDLGIEQKSQWTNAGGDFVLNAINSELELEIKSIESEIQKILRTDDVDIEIKKIEKSFISPLMKKARAAMDKIAEGDKDPSLANGIEEIKSQIESVYKDKIDPIMNAAQSSDKISPEDKKKLFDLKRKKREVGSRMMSDVYSSIMSSSTITDEEAHAWANAQEITSSAASRLRKSGYPPAEVKRDLATYYKLLNGRIDECRIVTTGSNRASASLNTSTIDIDGEFNRTVLYHEMSHLLERDMLLREVNGRFIRDRATGEAEQIRVLTNNYQYSADEMALPDGFLDPYVGKLYFSGATEVASMGVQQFTSPEHMYQLYDADPEMFNIIVGMMIGMTKDQKQRQRQQLRDKVLAVEFYSTLSKHVESLNWVKGHTMGSDDEYEMYQDITKVGKKNYDYVKKWYWKETLGECLLRPAKAKGVRKQFYVVELENGTRQSFKEKLLAQAFCYLYELSRLKSKPDTKLILNVVSKKLCPDWYDGGELPPL